MNLWILSGHTPIQVDILEWAPWLETHDNSVARTDIKGSEVWISTIFTGIDHAMLYDDEPDHVPELFETMVFNLEELDGQAWRWRSWDEAIAGHDHLLLQVLDLIKAKP